MRLSHVSPLSHIKATTYLPFLYPSLYNLRATAFVNPSVLLPRCVNHCKKPENIRSFHRTSQALSARPPKSHDRGPPSSEDTQTDFAALNVLGNTAPPATGVDACTHDGFVLNNDVRVAGSGVLLVGGEAFRWRPWAVTNGSAGPAAEGKRGDDGLRGSVKDSKGLWEAQISAWGVLDLVWPKPGKFFKHCSSLRNRALIILADLLILGTGPSIRPPSSKTRQHLHDLGIRLEVQDTRNAAAQFNLLATERGLTQVAAALVPVGWRE